MLPAELGHDPRVLLVQEKALAGNTIFFAQPTADVPSMELPPPPDALVDSLNVIFVRNLDDLSKAEWAIVNRDEYLKIVRERKQHCPVFADVSICKDDQASSRLPESTSPPAPSKSTAPRMLSSGWKAQLHASQMRVDSRKPETSQILQSLSRTLLRSPLPLMTAPLTYLSCPSLSILFTTSSP